MYWMFKETLNKVLDKRKPFNLNILLATDGELYGKFSEDHIIESIGFCKVSFINIIYLSEFSAIDDP